jgi:Ca2+-binding RTX toxin-like protein
LEFKEGITKDDLIVKLSPNSNDLIIAIKEDGKSFDELSDVITIKDWFNVNNRIENFRFADGTVLSVNDIVNLQGTDEDDTARFVDGMTSVNLSMGDGDDTVQGSSGDDIINGGNGDDVINGGYGNDIVNGGDGNDTLYGEAGNDTIYGGDGDDIIYGGGNNIIYFGSSDDDIIYGGDGNDIINSGYGNDIINGGDGDDIINGSEGNDIIEGGKGDDALNGGQGDDTYIYGRGNGKDTVYDDYRYGSWYQYNGGNDTLEFKEGITKDDVIIKLSADSNDLIIAIKEDGKSFNELSDIITIKDWFNVNNRIENFRFSNGTALSVNDIINLQGTDENDTARFLDSTTPINLSMGDGDDTVQSGRGDDIINGGSGNDIINSGDGNDIINGDGDDDFVNSGRGNDIIEGGKGNDTLNGGQGDDIYIYGKGDGKDIVLDTDGNDTLEFKEGITKDDLTIKLSSNDLIIAIKEDGKSFSALTDVITMLATS